MYKSPTRNPQKVGQHPQVQQKIPPKLVSPTLRTQKQRHVPNANPNRAHIAIQNSNKKLSSNPQQLHDEYQEGQPQHEETSRICRGVHPQDHSSISNTIQADANIHINTHTQNLHNNQSNNQMDPINNIQSGTQKQTNLSHVVKQVAKQQKQKFMQQKSELKQTVEYKRQQKQRGHQAKKNHKKSLQQDTHQYNFNDQKYSIQLYRQKDISNLNGNGNNVTISVNVVHNQRDPNTDCNNNNYAADRGLKKIKENNINLMNNPKNIQKGQTLIDRKQVSAYANQSTAITRKQDQKLHQNQNQQQLLNQLQQNCYTGYLIKSTPNIMDLYPNKGEGKESKEGTKNRDCKTIFGEKKLVNIPSREDIISDDNLHKSLPYIEKQRLNTTSNKQKLVLKVNQEQNSKKNKKMQEQLQSEQNQHQTSLSRDNPQINFSQLQQLQKSMHSSHSNKNKANNLNLNINLNVNYNGNILNNVNTSYNHSNSNINNANSIMFDEEQQQSRSHCWNLEHSRTHSQINSNLNDQHSISGLLPVEMHTNILSQINKQEQKIGNHHEGNLDMQLELPTPIPNHSEQFQKFIRDYVNEYWCWGHVQGANPNQNNGYNSPNKKYMGVQSPNKIFSSSSLSVTDRYGVTKSPNVKYRKLDIVCLECCEVLCDYCVIFGGINKNPVDHDEHHQISRKNKNLGSMQPSSPTHRHQKTSSNHHLLQSPKSPTVSSSKPNISTISISPNHHHFRSPSKAEQLTNPIVKSHKLHKIITLEQFINIIVYVSESYTVVKSKIKEMKIYLETAKKEYESEFQGFKMSLKGHIANDGTFTDNNTLQDNHNNNTQIFNTSIKNLKNALRQQQSQDCIVNTSNANVNLNTNMYLNTNTKGSKHNSNNKSLSDVKLYEDSPQISKISNNYTVNMSNIPLPQLNNLQHSINKSFSSSKMQTVLSQIAKSQQAQKFQIHGRISHLIQTLLSQEQIIYRQLEHKYRQIKFLQTEKYLNAKKKFLDQLSRKIQQREEIIGVVVESMFKAANLILTQGRNLMKKLQQSQSQTEQAQNNSNTSSLKLKLRILFDNLIHLVFHKQNDYKCTAQEAVEQILDDMEADCYSDGVAMDGMLQAGKFDVEVGVKFDEYFDRNVGRYVYLEEKQNCKQHNNGYQEQQQSQLIVTPDKEQHDYMRREIDDVSKQSGIDTNMKRQMNKKKQKKQNKNSIQQNQSLMLPISNGQSQLCQSQQYVQNQFIYKFQTASLSNISVSNTSQCKNGAEDRGKLLQVKPNKNTSRRYENSLGDSQEGLGIQNIQDRDKDVDNIKTIRNRNNTDFVYHQKQIQSSKNQKLNKQKQLQKIPQIKRTNSNQSSNQKDPQKQRLLQILKQKLIQKQNAKEKQLLMLAEQKKQKQKVGQKQKQREKEKDRKQKLSQQNPHVLSSSQRLGLNKVKSFNNLLKIQQQKYKQKQKSNFKLQQRPKQRNQKQRQQELNQHQQQIQYSQQQSQQQQIRHTYKDTRNKASNLVKNKSLTNLTFHIPQKQSANKINKIVAIKNNQGPLSKATNTIKKTKVTKKQQQQEKRPATKNQNISNQLNSNKSNNNYQIARNNTSNGQSDIDIQIDSSTFSAEVEEQRERGLLQENGLRDYYGVVSKSNCTQIITNSKSSITINSTRLTKQNHQQQSFFLQSQYSMQKSGVFSINKNSQYVSEISQQTNEADPKHLQKNNKNQKKLSNLNSGMKSPQPKSKYKMELDKEKEREKEKQKEKQKTRAKEKWQRIDRIIQEYLGFVDGDDSKEVGTSNISTASHSSNKILNLSDLDLSNAQVYQILSQVHSRLSKPKQQSEQDQQSSPGTPRAQKLKYLKLSNNNLSDQGFLKIIPYLSSVSNLNLSNNILTDKVLQHISKNKDRLAPLRIINLKGNLFKIGANNGVGSSVSLGFREGTTMFDKSKGKEIRDKIDMLGKIASKFMSMESFRRFPSNN